MTTETKKKTHVAIVLDRSGSMWEIREQAVAGYNQQIKTFKEMATTQDISVSLVSFNDEAVEHYWEQSADACQEAAQGDYTPGGNTALYDAWFHTINKLQETTDQSGDTAYLVVIITDGQENWSRHVTGQELFTKIGALEATGKWTFAPMCASRQQMEELSKATGINHANFAVWNSSNKGTAAAAYHNNALRSKKYFEARSLGASNTSNFYSDEISCCADYSNESLDVDDTNIQVTNTVRGIVAAQAFTPGASCCANTAPVDTADNATGGARIFSTGQKVEWKS